MEWKLWLDDVRNPSLHGGRDYIWARDVEQAQYYVKMWEPPKYMALDHDLGVPMYNYAANVCDTEDVMMFLKWLARVEPTSCPEYHVHSANLGGQQNIISFMESWKKSLSFEAETHGEEPSAQLLASQVERGREVK